MSLADGDYRQVEAKAVETILADDGPGGLRETGAPAAAAVMAADPALAAFLGQDDFPAILIRVTAKRELPSTPAYSIVKIFTLAAVVLDRGMDRPAVEDSVRRIAARLEQLLREQTATDKQFLGLPDLIEGSEGVLVCTLAETVFSATEAGPDRVLARAQVSAELQVPCAFRFE